MRMARIVSSAWLLLSEMPAEACQRGAPTL
jgi:hypothetical protein